MQPTMYTSQSNPTSQSSAPQVFTSPDGSAPDQYGAPAAHGRRHSLFKLWAVVGALVVFAGGYYANFAVVSASQSNASATAQAFVAALNSGNNERAYAMASDGLHSQQSQSQFSDAMGDLKATKPVQSGKTVDFSNGQATYIVTEDGLPATSSGSTTGTFTILLVKTGLTGWKIDSVNVN